MIARRGGAHRWPTSAALRALTIAPMVAAEAALLHLVIVPRMGIEFYLAGLLRFKAMFGSAVALIATPLAVSLALRDN